MSMILAKMSVERTTYHSRYWRSSVRQQWDFRDSVVHRAYTVFDAATFATLLHDTYWRALGYSMVFDFDAKKFCFKTVPARYSGFGAEELRVDELAGSFGAYNLKIGMMTWSFIRCYLIRRVGRFPDQLL